MGGPLVLQLEDNHPPVVTRSEQIEAGVAGEDPEPVVLPPEGVEAGPLVHVPDSEELVLGVRQVQVLTRMKDGAGDVVVVTSTRANLGLQIYE